MFFVKYGKGSASKISFALAAAVLPMAADAAPNDIWVTGSNTATDPVPTLLKSTNEGASWYSQTPPAVAPYALNFPATMYGLDFIDASTGWMVGKQGNILKSTNGGASWSFQDMYASYSQPANTFTQLRDVQFIDANTGWAVGRVRSDQFGANVGGNILNTSDGGATWNVKSYSTDGLPLYSVDFVDANNGWAVGGASGTPKVMHTSDGGASWTYQTAAVGANHLRSVDFIDASNGWAVGTGDTIMYTTDGGTNWLAQSVVIGPNNVANLLAVDFVDALNGWAVGFDNDTLAGTLSRLILNTTDGGLTWSQQAGVPASGFLGAVDFVDSSTGWAVGGGGAILHTTDGGANWVQQTSGVTVSLRAIDIVPVPEPGTYALLGSSMLLIASARRKAAKTNA